MLKLKDGKVIVGKIVERNDHVVKMDTGIGIAVTYYMDEIELLDGEVVAPARVDQPETKKTVTPEESVVIIEPIELLKPKGAPEPIKDITVIEEQAQSKETSSPFGPTVREVNSTMGVSQRDNQADQTPRLSQAELPLEEQLNESKTVPDEERINMLMQNFHKFTGLLIDSYKAFESSLDNTFPILQEKLQKVPLKDRQDFLIIGSLACVILYVFVFAPLMVIAQKLNCRRVWLIWIPLVQIFYFIYMARKSYRWFILFLIPIINLITPIALFASILKRLKHSPRLALLLIIPVVNLILLWCLALQKEEVKVTRW